MKKIHLLFYLLVVIDTLGQSPYGTQIGLTYYDLPSNASSPNRVVYNEDDQSVSVTWTQSITELAQPVSFDRGAGYNHFRPTDGWVHGDEGACRTLNACAQEYTGWPEIINFPKQAKLINGIIYNDIKREVILGHSGGLKKIARRWRSDSAWNEVEDLLIDQDYCGNSYNGLWPRAVSQGQNNIYMIAVHQPSDFQPGNYAPCFPYTSVSTPLLYYRSTDQGQSWDIKNFVLPGLEDSTLFSKMNGDEYAIAVNANVVAIVAGGIGQNWVMWKSEDYGETWNYTVVKYWKERSPEYPNYFSDSSDAKLTIDGAHSVTIDDNGNVHCFVGHCLAKLDSIGKVDTLKPLLNAGLWYWNDKLQNFCEPIAIANLVDYVAPNGTTRSSPLHSNDSGWNPFDNMEQNIDMSNYNASAISMPSASVDAQGNLYVVYSADVEGTEYIKDLSTETASTRDIYLVWSNDNGNNWSKEINIADEIANAVPGEVGTTAEEDAYPMLPKRVGSDNMLHMVWNLDYVPGSDVQRDAGEFSLNYVYYYGINTVSDLPPFIQKTSINLSLLVSEFYISETQVQVGDTVLVSVDSGYIAFEPYETFVIDGKDFNNQNDSVYLVMDSLSKYVHFTNIIGNRCIVKDSSQVFNVIDGKLESIIDQDSIITCSGDSIELFGYGSGASTYLFKWNTGDSVQTIKVSPSINTLYKLEVNNSVSDSIWVIVNPIPEVDAGEDLIIPAYAGCNNDVNLPFEYLLGTGTNNDTSNKFLWYKLNGYINLINETEINPKVLGLNDGHVAVKATNNYGCIAYDTVYVKIDCIGSVEEKSNVDIQIFPNPTNDHVTIYAGDKIKSYHLYDVFGKLIKSKIENQKRFKIDVQTLSKGIYILQMNVNEEIISKKIDIY